MSRYGLTQEEAQIRAERLARLARKAAPGGSLAPSDRLPFVRYLDGRLVLGGTGGDRPLTFRERLAWRLARRTPRP